MKKIWTWLKQDGNAITAFVLGLCFVLIIISTITKCVSKPSPVEGYTDKIHDSIIESADSIKKEIIKITITTDEKITEIDNISDSDAIKLFKELLNR